MMKVAFWILLLATLNSAFSGDAVDLSWPSTTSLSDDELAHLVVSMVGATDRLKHLDPFELLQHPEQALLGHRNTGQKLNLTLPTTVKAWHVEQVKQVLTLDRFQIIPKLVKLMDDNNEVDEKTLPNFVLRYLIAPFTPVLNVDDKCFRQSMGYVSNLLDLKLWSIMMLDSTGKIPDGILADMMDLCSVLDFWVYPDLCNAAVNATIDLCDLLLGCASGPSEICSFCKENVDEIVIPGIKNLQIPNGNTVALGSFDGCLRVSAVRNQSQSLQWEDFEGQHCIIRLAASDGVNPAPRSGKVPRVGWLPGWVAGLQNEDIKSLAGLVLPVMNPTFGVCIPDGCTELDILLNYEALYEGMGAIGYPLTCETQKTQDDIKDLSDGAIFVITLYSLIALLMLLGTGLDVYQQLTQDEEALEQHRDNFFVAMLKCFSININGKKVLNSDQPKGNSHLGCLSGIRVISILWVVLGHTYLVAGSVFLKNPQKSSNLFVGRSEQNYEIVMNALPSVDTFFFMSGLLVAYLSFIEMEKKRFNLALFYLHRYIRLTIPLGLYIAFNAEILPLIGQGPNWYLIQRYTQGCRDNWWSNLLYVNNFLDPSEQCAGVSWFLACDMQWFFITPLFLYPLFYYNKRYGGYAFWALGMVVATAIPMIIAGIHHLPPTHVFIYQIELNMERWFYEMMYTRGQPYLIGILLGYILFITRDKEIKIHWLINCGLWLVSLAAGFAVIFGLTDIRRQNTYVKPGWNDLDTLFYIGFHRIAWGLALSWVVFACVKGYGGLINKFLSWGIFLSLARITYMVYIIHFDVLLAFFNTITYSVELTDVIVSYYYVGLTMITFGIAFVATLTIEAPFISLEKLVISGIVRSSTKSKQRENVTTKVQEEKDKLETRF